MRLPTWKKVLLVLLSLLLALVLGRYAYYRYQYPFGASHRVCSRNLVLELIFYAEDHDGKFPTGGATPGASLCKLYPEYIDAATLAGRGKSPEIARKDPRFRGVLGPYTCDWHYTDGLTRDDNSMIAILWGKASLGHVCQNLHGGHEIVRLVGSVEVIPAEKWDAFLAEQAELLAMRKTKAPTP